MMENMKHETLKILYEKLIYKQNIQICIYEQISNNYHNDV
jgi:hypothetical protein